MLLLIMIVSMSGVLLYAVLKPPAVKQSKVRIARRRYDRINRPNLLTVMSLKTETEASSSLQLMDGEIECSEAETALHPYPAREG